MSKSLFQGGARVKEKLLKRKGITRVLSVMLSLMMCLTLMPVTAFAAGDGGSGEYTLTPLPSDISRARINPTPGVTGEKAIEICQGESYDAVIYKVEGSLYYFIIRDGVTWDDPNRGFSLEYIDNVSSYNNINSWAVIGTVVDDGADIFTPLPTSIENIVVKPVEGLTLEQALEICKGSSYNAVIYKIEGTLVYFVIRGTEWMDSGRPMGLDYIQSIPLDNWAVIGTIEGHEHDWKFEAVKSSPSLEMADTILYYCSGDGCPSGYTKDSPLSLILYAQEGLIVTGTTSPVSFSSDINAWEEVTGKAKPVINYYKDALLTVPVADISKEISGTYYAAAKVEGTDVVARTRFTIAYVAEDLLVGNANAGNTIKSKDFDESDTFLANPDYWMDVWLDDGYINTSWIYTPAGSSVEEEIEGTTFNEWGGSELTLKPEWVGGTIYVIIDLGDGVQVRSKALLIKEATVELSWQDDSYVGQWNAYPGATEYWVVLYKDGKAITDRYSTTRPGPVFDTKYDFTTMLEANGNGVYSFKVSPYVDGEYLSNDNWAPSIAYGVTPTECAHYYAKPIGVRKAATCTEAGLTEGSKCADCGKILRAQTEIKKLNHDYSIEIGEGQHKCSMCGDIKVDFNLTWEENSYVGQWNAYPGASRYWVVLYKDGRAITDSYRTTRPGPVDGTSYDFRSMIQGMGSGKYKFAVSPYVDGAYKSNDIFSAEITYVPHTHVYVIDGKVNYVKLSETEHTKKCIECGFIDEANKIPHNFETVVTKATTSKDGKIVVQCKEEGCKYIKSTTKIDKITEVKLAKTSYSYTGSAIKPAVTVKDSAGKTIDSSNYTVAYSNNKAIGTATAKVTFKGNYSGTKSLTYTIVPKQVTLKGATGGDKAVTLIWDKGATGTTGYQVYRATSKNGTYTKVATIKKIGTVTYTDKSLEAGKTYYYKVRAYATIDSKNIYSEYSAIKSVKTYTNTESFVARIYTKALGRDPEAAGLKYWTDEINAKRKTPVEVAELFFFAPEFTDKNLNDTEYVKVLYRTFMGREYDQGGLEYWLSQLKSGMSRKQVLESFAGCKEFQDIIVSFGL